MYGSTPSRTLRLFLAVACAISLLALVRDGGGTWRRGPPETAAVGTADRSRSGSSSNRPGGAQHDDDEHFQDPCASLPPSFATSVLSSVVVVLKTGATEIYDKLPIHLATTFACPAVEYAVYSDLEQEVGTTHVRDALASVSEELREGAAELAQYRLLREHGGRQVPAGKANWELDRWKFLPMIGDVWRRYGGEGISESNSNTTTTASAAAATTGAKKWFLFIEADTYISLYNLVLWLQHLESSASISPASEALYAGAPVKIRTTDFAHGGSGILLSAHAAGVLTQTYEADRRLWEGKIKDVCCGDRVVAEVLLAAAGARPVELTGVWPHLQGESPATLDWSGEVWCRAPVTWHHVDAGGVDRLWRFERDRSTSGDGEKGKRRKGKQRQEGPILFRDYFDFFVYPRLSGANHTLQDWDNLSTDWSMRLDDQDPELAAYAADADACEAFCSEQRECVHWVWSAGQCRANKRVRLGWHLTDRPSLGSADDRVQNHGAGTDGGRPGAVSGWIEARVEEFRLSQGSCEDGAWARYVGA